MSLENSMPRQVVQLVPFDEPPASLGGMPPSGIDHVAMTSGAYSTLERMASLPTPSRARKIDDADVKDAFLKICNGDFVAAWAVENNVLKLDAGFNGEQACVVMDLYATPERDNNLRPEVSGSVFGGLEDWLKDMLIERVLHHSLRFFGAQWPFKFVGIAQTILFGRYSTKRFQEVLDLNVTVLDIAIKQDVGALDINIINTLVFGVGMSLRSLGRPLDAALVLEEIADTYGGEGTSSIDRSVVLGLSAESFAHAGHYERSNEAFVKSIELTWKRQGGGVLGVNENYMHTRLEDFVSMLIEWCSREPDKEREKYLMTFTGLLAASGYKPKIVEHSACIVLENCCLLKNKYRKKKQANRVLVQAIQGADAANFRATILGCKRPGLTAELHAKVGSTSKPSRTTAPIDSKALQKEAQETLRQVGGVLAQAVYVNCGDPDCVNCVTNVDRNTLMACPCQQVYYCSKSCQVAHWKEHKRTCAYHAGGKKSKK